MTVPVAVDGPHGPIRLKWHKLRTRPDEAPFRPANLALGWQLGATLEIDIAPTADQRFLVAHDATLGPTTTGRGRLAARPLAATSGLMHRNEAGAPDPDAPVLSLAELLAPLGAVTRGPTASLQLDLKLPDGKPLADAAAADAASAVAGLESAIVVSGYDLEAARRLSAILPGARLGYDPMRAVSRDPDLGRDPVRLFRHLQRRSAGVSIAYLRFDLVVASETMGVPLVGRLLELGIETDAWTVNPGPGLHDAALRALVQAKVRRITTDAPREIERRIAGLCLA